MYIFSPDQRPIQRKIFEKQKVAPGQHGYITITIPFVARAGELDRLSKTWNEKSATLLGVLEPPAWDNELTPIATPGWFGTIARLKSGHSIDSINALLSDPDWNIGVCDVYQSPDEVSLSFGK